MCSVVLGVLRSNVVATSTHTHYAPHHQPRSQQSALHTSTINRTPSPPLAPTTHKHSSPPHPSPSRPSPHDKHHASLPPSPHPAAAPNPSPPNLSTLAPAPPQQHHPTPALITACLANMACMAFLVGALGITRMQDVRSFLFMTKQCLRMQKNTKGSTPNDKAMPPNV